MCRPAHSSTARPGPSTSDCSPPASTPPPPPSSPPANPYPTTNAPTGANSPTARRPPPPPAPPTPPPNANAAQRQEAHRCPRRHVDPWQQRGATAELHACVTAGSSGMHSCRRHQEYCRQVSPVDTPAGGHPEPNCCQLSGVTHPHELWAVLLQGKQ